MGSGGAGTLAVWASTAWSLCEGRLGDNTYMIENHHAVILGDVNAAPPGGIWEYSQWSATRKENLVMNK
jgi:hypothetical protein